jgi:CheY-like chemotaxis protein/HPt (histidine-containing phosphotransfer) domain-containing protein
MSSFRILVVDDEPDLRKVIERSLARDPELTIRACASGEAALQEAAAWSPDLILLDFMMPGMDGPSTLARLRQNASTAAIPVVFLTARARAEELDRLISAGAVGAIAKPFEPKALREAVRVYLGAAGAASAASGTTEIEASHTLEGPLASEQNHYRSRLRSDAAKLRVFRTKLETDLSPDVDVGELRSIVHKLAGSAGIYGFGQVSRSASELEKTIVATSSGQGQQADLVVGLDNLLEGIARS